MEPVRSLFDQILPFFPAGIALLGVIGLLFLVRYLLEKRSILPSARKFHQQVTMLVISLCGAIAIVLALPLNDALRGQLIGLLGILLSASMALSSTTFIGNAMAGVMLRIVKVFKSGDFIEVEEYFGRVTERGLFHTEIQTERRDLVTLPNLYLATHAITVTRSTGTIVFAEVSLGYDVPTGRIEELLLEALRSAGLDDGYVQIRELGDFSVNYRAAGLLKDVRHLLSARSRLRAEMLDALHGGKIEIVSPTFMNTRAFAPERQFTPGRRRQREGDSPRAESKTPESIVFDKADDAESLERLVELHTLYQEKVDALRKEAKAAQEKEEKERLEVRILRLEESRSRTEKRIEILREDID